MQQDPIVNAARLQRAFPVTYEQLALLRAKAPAARETGHVCLARLTYRGTKLELRLCTLSGATALAGVAEREDPIVEPQAKREQAAGGGGAVASRNGVAAPAEPLPRLEGVLGLWHPRQPGHEGRGFIFPRPKERGFRVAWRDLSRALHSELHLVEERWTGDPERIPCRIPVSFELAETPRGPEARAVDLADAAATSNGGADDSFPPSRKRW